MTLRTDILGTLQSLHVQIHVPAQPTSSCIQLGNWSSSDGTCPLAKQALVQSPGLHKRLQFAMMPPKMPQSRGVTV